MNTSPQESQAISGTRVSGQSPLIMADAEFRSNIIGTQYDAAGGYLGGSAAHVWSDDDFWSIPHQTRRLPIWVGAIGDVSRTTPADDAYHAILRLQQLTVPFYRVIALDMETSADHIYVEVFGHLLHDANYLVWVYGSLDNITKLPPLDGRWIAHPESLPTGPAIPHEVARQYETVNNIDKSRIFNGRDYRHLW